MSRHVVLNATAYDDLPSGARSRALGIAAALIAGGARVTLFAPRARSFAALVEAELGRAPGDGFAEIQTPLDPARPVNRALGSRKWLAGHVPADADLFVTDFYPVLDEVPTALTIHDLRYLETPDHGSLLRATWFRVAYPATARRAPLVVVPTQAIGDAVESRLGVAPARIRCVPNGLSRPWLDTPAELPEPAHFLAVGVPEPRKDLATAVAAIRGAHAQGGPVLPLVIVGRSSPRLEALLAGSRDLVAANLLRHEGVVPDGRLVDLCRHSAALLHPSRYEGFGLSVLEAMSQGIRVLAGRCPAVEEVGGDLVHWLPPGDVGRWASAVCEAAAAGAPPQEERAAARERAHGFTWVRAAEALLAAIPG